MSLINILNKEKLQQYVAIIMNGNGSRAKKEVKPEK